MRLKSAALIFAWAFCLAACSQKDLPESIQTKACQDPTGASAISLPGGTFQMGSDNHYSDEGPVRTVTLAPFKIDPFEVTRAQFQEFIKATGYVTVAERKPDPTLHPNIPEDKLVAGSAVFSMAVGDSQAGRWQFVPGAAWDKPDGAQSKIAAEMNHPVNHIAYEDALAFAAWAGGDLPSEAQWEYAARGGLDGSAYEWGDLEPDQMDIPRANTWQGIFPVINRAEDGYVGTAPVGCYEPNGYGLYDMTGNLWEWTKDSDLTSNQGIIKGGSYLCASNYCRRYRPAARQNQELDFSTNHIGFRLVYPADKP